MSKKISLNDNVNKISEDQVKVDGKAPSLDATRVELLKDYIHRLNDGDSLESVREDFVANFATVDASEIAKAEQEIIAGGVPVEEVQKLCDVHSALFHGTTKLEKVGGFKLPIAGQIVEDVNVSKEPVIELSQIPGHPVNVYMRENDIIAELIEAVRRAEGPEVFEELKKLRAISAHYASQGDLVYPLLNRKYGFSGPSNVMWGVDDEIRDELRALNSAGESLKDFKERLDAVLTRAEEMLYKENSILLPLCANEFSEEDWMRLYYEMPSYETCLAEGYPIWQAAEDRREDLRTIAGRTAESFKKEDLEEAGYIALGSGRMTPKEIEAVLNTIPLELTFVNEEDINSYHNRGFKLFKRPDMAIGRDVWACHPPKVEVLVRKVMDDFKAGKRDKVDVWMYKEEEPVLVQYLAVRDEEGGYIGTLESVQLLGFARDYFSK